MFEPDFELLNLSMLYEPKWNGLVEGPTWDAWWVQNSYGTTYAALPFLQEPFLTFLQNSQDLWFDQMGDGERAGAQGWVAPDGCLCDAARPGWIYYKQGDGRIQIHDWGMEFTAAGVVMQGELLLIGRDPEAIRKYLPRLNRSLDFIESRRDPKNNLFLAGPAGNLLAPSFAGWKRPDGTYDKAYLTGLSITYMAALDRVIELEKLAGTNARAIELESRRSHANDGLTQMTMDEGYFIRSLDPDGTKHGVYGAAEHGYLETSPNHDAIALRIVGDEQAKKIYDKIASIPQLRPHAFILPNYPGYDDMYEQPAGLWEFGRWVNGGHWSTCEGRMMLAYSRLNKFDDIRASMKQLMKFVTSFRMDNPLTERGNAVYQPNEPINICYDAFAPPAAMIRGLFEYVYSAQGLDLICHVPDSITELQQIDPIRFGKQRVFISVHGAGPISGVMINGVEWKRFDEHLVTLKPDELPADRNLNVVVLRGGAQAPENIASADQARNVNGPPEVDRLSRFIDAMNAVALGDSYEAAHARLARDAYQAARERARLLKSGELKALEREKSEEAADRLYADAARKLQDGLDARITSYKDSADPAQRKIHQMWTASAAK